MSTKRITEAEMYHLRNTLTGDDQAAIWTVLTLLKLSTKDTPFYAEKEIVNDCNSDEPWGFAEVEYYEYYKYYLGDKPISVREFITTNNYATAIAALSHDTFKDFKLFEECKAEGHERFWQPGTLCQAKYKGHFYDATIVRYKGKSGCQFRVNFDDYSVGANVRAADLRERDSAAMQSVPAPN